MYSTGLVVPLALTLFIGVFAVGPLVGLGENLFDGSPAALLTTFGSG